MINKLTKFTAIDNEKSVLPKGKRRARDEDISLPEKADDYDDIQFDAATFSKEMFTLSRQDLSFVEPAYLDTDRLCSLSSKSAVASMNGGSFSGSPYHSSDSSVTLSN